MKAKELSGLRNEELLKRERRFKIIVLLLAVGLGLLFISALYSTIQRGFTSVLIIPIVLLPILFVNIKRLNNIKKELKSGEE